MLRDLNLIIDAPGILKQSLGQYSGGGTLGGEADTFSDQVLGRSNFWIIGSNGNASHTLAGKNLDIRVFLFENPEA